MIESNSKQDGSPVLRAIFSEVNCLGYIEGKALLIAPYAGEGCTAHSLADEGSAWPQNAARLLTR